VKYHFKIQIVFFVGLVLFSCSKDQKQKPLNEQILAKVGKKVITASDFKYSYEFSFAPLRRGVSQRHAYLDYMVKELLLSNEGYRLGYHKNRYVKSRVNNRRRNDLLEAFFVKYVHSKVNIPDDKLQDAIKKGSVKWRMIFWPTPSLQDAQDVRIEASKSDLEDFIEKQIAGQEIRLKEKKFYETDWLDFLDLKPEVFDKIKDLEVGKVSEPILYGNGYALAQIIDMNLEGIKADELKAGARRKKMYARLHDIETERIVHALMDSIITPLDVRVKGGIVEQLAPPLFEWMKNGFPEKGSFINIVKSAPDTAKSFVLQIKDLINKTLITSEDGNRTVEDFLRYLSYHRKILKQSTSYKNFKERMITEIGTMFKNEIFVEIAEDDGYADSTRIIDDLRTWEQKWTYDVFRTETVKKLSVTEQEMQDFFKYNWRELPIANVDTTRFYKYESQVYNFLLHKKHLALLESRLKKLKRRYPVWINQKLLDELELSDGTKTHQTSLFARKNFTGEAIVPTVDMKWIQF
jgi:hypothetical protein